MSEHSWSIYFQCLRDTILELYLVPTLRCPVLNSIVSGTSQVVSEYHSGIITLEYSGVHLRAGHSLLREHEFCTNTRL